MTKTRRAGATPKLRFPEFREAGAWTARQLGQLAELLTERVGASTCTPYTVASGVGLVSQQEKLGRTIAGNSIKNYIVLQRNDFAFNKSATKAYPEGYIARYIGADRAAVPNSIFTCFRVNERSVDPAYLEFLFASNLHGRWLRKYIAVGARAHGSLNVNDDDLLAVPVPLPSGAASMQEQRKIADCLTSLDEVIAAQARKVEALKAHKRGLMKQLFPRDGETVPQLRFPEFRGGAEWTIVPLGQLLQGRPQYGVNAPAVPFAASLPMYLRITDIDEDGRFISGNKASVDAELTDDDYLEPGDITLARTGASVGKSYRYRREDGRLVFGGFLIRIRPDQARVAPAFLASYFTTDRYWKWVRATSGRSGQPGVNGGEYAALPVPIPPSSGSSDELAEQQRIGECFESLEAQIASAKGALGQLKQHKQGLLQQLFPSAEGQG